MILSEILHYWTRFCDAGRFIILVFGFVYCREEIFILIFHTVFKLLNITSEIIQIPPNSLFVFPLSHLQSASLLNFPQRLAS